MQPNYEKALAQVRAGNANRSAAKFIANRQHSTKTLAPSHTGGSNRDALLTEALTKLRHGIASTGGKQDFFDEAFELLKQAGVDTSKVSKTVPGASHLAETLERQGFKALVPARAPNSSKDEHGEDCRAGVIDAADRHGERASVGADGDGFDGGLFENRHGLVGEKLRTAGPRAEAVADELTKKAKKRSTEKARDEVRLVDKQPKS
jgi:hypothetical protein